MAKDKDTKPRLLDVLEQATSDDLVAVQEQIAEHEKQLNSLRAVEKLLSIRINGKPARKQREPKQPKTTANAAPGGQMSGGLAKKILDLVLSRGPCLPETAARLLATSEQGIRVAVGQSSLLTIEDGKIVNTGS